jgi:hypothetical protein
MNHPFTSALHETLLRVAGWLPDDALASARSILADDRCGAVAQLLAFEGRRTILPLTEDDLDALGALLEAEGLDPALLDSVEIAAENASILWHFSAEWEEQGETDEDEDANHARLISALAEQDLLAAVADEPGIRALWSAVRRPVDGMPYPPARVIYVAEIDDDDDENSRELAELTGQFQEKLIAAGESDPQVELVSIHSDRPDYQRAAQVGGKLLWSVNPDVEIKVARVFDEVDPEDGPKFAPDRPTIADEDERERLIDYLESGTELLVTTATMDDVVDPERGAVVPTSFRTDGTWVWTDTVTYYLHQHNLAPDPELLEHIRAVDGLPRRADSVSLGRALKALTPSADAQPVWTSS